ncbi:MAG TPA: phage holin family protein [Thermoanaerobaculia bacterium]|nr:phage holin family protein [Thermoanaerobaculia bacterium]
MLHAFLQVVLNGVAILIASRIVPGIHYKGGIVYLLVVGLVIGLVNLLVKPIVTFFAFPLIILTLGLFYLVINGLMLYLASLFLSGLRIDGCAPAILGGVIIALVNWLVRAFSGR